MDVVLNSHSIVSTYLYHMYMYIDMLSYLCTTIKPRFNDVCMPKLTDKK